MTERDHAAIIAALRRKARDPAVTGTPEEAALNAKADELEKKYSAGITYTKREDFIKDHWSMTNVQWVQHIDGKMYAHYTRKDYQGWHDIIEEPEINEWNGWAPSEGE
jgi:hypothetical protein